MVFTMHVREFCMMWIIRGWTGSAIGPEQIDLIMRVNTANLILEFKTTTTGKLSLPLSYLKR